MASMGLHRRFGVGVEALDLFEGQQRPPSTNAVSAVCDLVPALC
jgi:hypothetical protein